MIFGFYLTENEFLYFQKTSQIWQTCLHKGNPSFYHSGPDLHIFSAPLTKVLRFARKPHPLQWAESRVTVGFDSGCFFIDQAIITLHLGCQLWAFQMNCFFEFCVSVRF